jgi:hypothetical protein
MKKNPLRSAWLAPALLAAAAAAPAASFDLASYLALTPGNWAILRDDGTGVLNGYVTSANAAGQIAQTWYRFNGSSWIFDSTELFSVSARRLTYLGFDDGTATWLLEPPIGLARRQNVGDAAVYKGALRNQTTNALIPVVNALTFTADGLVDNGPAGAFTNCIKVRQYSYQDGGSRDSVSISCPGRSEVRTWITKIRDTADPLAEDLSDRRSAVMIQGGDSNPPLP